MSNDNINTSGNTNTSGSNTFTIHILGKEYQVACPPGQEDSLTKAAAHLDKQMRKIRDSGKIVGLERIAVMAALNLSYDLLDAQQKQTSTSNSAQDNLHRVNLKLDNALQRFRQLQM